MFDAGMHPTELAALLVVSTKSGYQWCRTWKSAGTRALASKVHQPRHAHWLRLKCNTWRPR
ncbi:hypothetical protein Rhe02_03820 [Rhizocola hellebori]|uniref:Uncharacterized protein n=1 Tax=Rhizocola hellebori TaxID=1392758 RepID=A0A8J3Q315_9ACTN|nr:hypothetical protein Rhe02_03820 [Rhizocola hellebori]